MSELWVVGIMLRIPNIHHYLMLSSSLVKYVAYLTDSHS